LISGIRITRFRGVRDGLLEELKQLTVLIGKNGAGKSTVLESLYLISACANSKDEVRNVSKLDYVVGRRGGRGSWDGSRRMLWYMGDFEQPIEIQIDVKGKTFKFLALDLPTSYYPIRLLDETGSLINLETGYYWRSVEAFKAGEPQMVRGVGDELLEVKRFLGGFLLIDWLLSKMLSNVEVYAWPRILTKRLDKRVIEIIREEFEPEAEGLTYIPGAEGFNYLALQTTKTAVRVDDLGDGAKAALISSMLILAYKPTILLVEEPELHMHPAGLYTYTRFLMRLSKEMGFQIIASTHSIEFVEMAKALSKDLGIESTVLYIERENDELKAKSFSLDDVEALRKLGIDVRLLDRF